MRSLHKKVQIEVELSALQIIKNMAETNIFDMIN